MQNYSQYNDYELVYMVQEENENAYQILYDKYQPLLRQIVSRFYSTYRYFGIEYEDLYQEANLALTKAIRAYQVSSNTLFYTFACITIRSKLKNLIKVSTSQKCLFHQNMLSLYDAINGTDKDVLLIDTIIDPDSLDPALELEKKNLAHQLFQFSLSLTVVQGQIFELKTAGFRNIDIAALLGMSLKDVSNYMYRIRRKLKRFLVA